jgi:hypothetical protein
MRAVGICDEILGKEPLQTLPNGITSPAVFTRFLSGTIKTI